MEKTIKLSAIISVVALSTTACAPSPMYHNNNAVAPSADTRVYSYPSRAVSSKTAVTHSHSGKIHSHPLPKAGIMHSHNVGAQTRPASYRPTTTARPQPQARPTARPAARPLVQYQPRPVTKPTARPYQPKPAPQARPTQPKPQVTQTYQAPVTKPVVATTSLPSNNYSYYSYGTESNTQAASKPKPTTSYYYNNETSKPKPTTTSNASTSYYNYYDYSAPAKSTAPKPKPVTTSTTSTGGSSYYDSYTKPTTPSASQTSSGDTYVVRRGDTVFQVMRNTGVYWKDIIRLNNLQAPEHRIVPGQRLRLK